MSTREQYTPNAGDSDITGATVGGEHCPTPQETDIAVRNVLDVMHQFSKRPTRASLGPQLADSPSGAKDFYDPKK